MNNHSVNPIARHHSPNLTVTGSKKSLPPIQIDLVTQSFKILAVANSTILEKNDEKIYEKRMEILKMTTKNQFSESERFTFFPEALEFFAYKNNRYPDVLPTSKGLVKLVSYRTQMETDYINASRFENMIITQGPLATTTYDFWIMVFEQNAKHIVCLTDHKGLNTRNVKGEKTYPYWKKNIAGPIFNREGKQLHLSVEKLQDKPHFIKNPMAANKKSENVTKRVFKIAVEDQVKEVTQWHYRHWVDYSICDHNLLAQLISQLLVHPDVYVIHCSAGIGRSGVLAIALKFIQEYLKTRTIPTETDIDKAIQELRLLRPGSVQSVDQRELISKTIFAYISIYK